MSPHRLALFVAGVLIAGVSSSFAQRAAPASAELRRVLELSTTTQIAPADGQGGTPLAVSFDALAQAVSDGGIIELPLTPALSVQAQVAWTGAEPSHSFVSGSLIGGPIGDFNLTAAGDTLVGRVVVDGRLFVIRRLGDSAVHVAREIDQRSFPPEAPPLVPPAVTQPDPVPPSGAPQDTNQFVDLLIVYTPAARAFMGSAANIQAELTGAVTYANTALANAGVTHRFRIVHLTEIAYVESNDDGVNLSNLTGTADGQLDAVHTLRDTYRADVVSLIERRANMGGTCGIGWVMQASNVNSGFAPNAFNVVEINCAYANLSLAHEIGHNMGLHHDVANAGGGQGAFSYAYGYGVHNLARTVMAYASSCNFCPRAAMFSSPLHGFPFVPGVPAATGVTAGTANADNARALNGTSLTVANFRQALPGCTYTLSATSFTIGNAGGAGTVGVTTQAGCAWTAVSNAAFIVVTGGASGTGSGLVSYTAAANTGAARTGTITIAGQTFTLSQGPSMTLSRSTLAYGATNTLGTLTNITAEQAVTVTFTGASPAWTATSSSSWLLITGGAKTGAGQFTVSVRSAASLPATGTVTGVVTVSAPGVANSPQSVVIRLTLFASTSTSASPFGSFDTPITGATGLSGAIPVSGWALDDIEVTRVEIWRDRVAGETTPVFAGPGLGNGKIYIADPLFVSGSRPDVEAANPTLPFANRAGWGYLMLTQGLFNRGTGTYTLYAFAFDRDGHSTSLGSKTITSNNATAVKPFGSIDTPTYGQTVSGSFWNFGWALTPNATPTCTIVNSNVFMAIDSGTLIPVSYGGLRTDIAAAFPGFSNGSGAGGAFFLDTTTLSNGTHQIGWFVVDNCNRSEGVGSRFFTVLNGSSTVPTDERTIASSIEVMPSAEPVVVRRSSSAQEIVQPGSQADRVIAVALGERIEVQLPSNAEPYSGAQVVNGERRALPLGSSLDASHGVFYWQPAAGFLGAQDLEFTAGDQGPVWVRVIVGTSVQTVIDTPRPGPVGASFVIAGWAIDQAAKTGTGIDTVHVWAYPSSGGSPIFLGVAEYGGTRNDVATTLGEQFANASYSLSVGGMLPPGQYQVVVYPHSSVTGDFRGAKAVAITVR